MEAEIICVASPLSFSRVTDGVIDFEVGLSSELDDLVGLESEVDQTVGLSSRLDLCE